MQQTNKRNPWAWIPTLYFAEAIPYVAVMTISVLMYKNLGLGNDEIAFYTSWLYLPWVIKPFWSPFIDLFKTKRWWIVAMQLLIGAGLAGVAFTLPMSNFFQTTLAFFWLMAFSSATHDIAADGFYMLGLDSHEQSLYVGIRSTFYRFATIAGQGLLVWFAGYVSTATGNTPLAWSLTFYIMAGLFIAFALYHFAMLPKPATDVPNKEETSVKNVATNFVKVVISFFKKPQVIPALLFILLFRLPEAQLVKISGMFLLDPVSKGGLGLSVEQVGIVQGTVGMLGLTIGGILGGIVASQGGLKKWLWPMVWAISLPDLVYIYLSYALPSNIYIISSCLFVEQFGYGFGFTAYMLYLIYYSRGENSTAHYAISTGLMAVGMMLPGMIAGKLQEWLGYQHFFIWIIVCCAVTFAVSAFLKIDKDFGRKTETEE